MVSHACMLIVHCAFMLFFLKDTAPTEISPLSLHAALPILVLADEPTGNLDPVNASQGLELFRLQDRKSTRLNSSHRCISYAVFCFAKDRFIPGLYYTLCLGVRFYMFSDRSAA